MYKKLLKSSLLIAFISFYLGFVPLAYAATFTIVQPQTGESAIDTTLPLKLPNESVTLNGTGEPGSTVTVKALRNSQVIFSTQTLIDANGRWQAVLPQFPDGVPTQLSIHSQVSLTATQILETALVSGAAVTNSVLLVQLFIDRVLRVFQSIGLLRRRKTKGFVFDTKTKRPVPFALLTIENQEKASGYTQPLKETVVSDVYGFFKVVNLPYGRYSISVSHPDYTFPSAMAKPWYANPLDFYQGETLEFVSQDDLDICFIPLDPHQKSKFAPGYWLHLKVIMQVLLKLSELLVIPMGIVSMLVMWFYPTLVNFAFCMCYVILLVIYVYDRWKTHALEGQVTMESGEAVPQAVVRMMHPSANNLVRVVLTDDHGYFKTRLPTGQYQVLVAKNGLLPDINQGMTIEVIDLQHNQTHLKYKMSFPPEPIKGDL